MSRDGYLMPGVEHSHPHFHGEEYECPDPDCGEPVDGSMESCPNCGRPIDWATDFEPEWEEAA